MKYVFVLEHLHTHDNDEECWKRIGIYKTREEALEAIQRVNMQPGFSDYPNIIDWDSTECKNGFNIDEYELNEDHWAEGYVTD